MPDDAPVNVYGFLDYRALLHALYAHKKQHEYGFSHRAFSRRAGLKSVNLLKLVMDGQRNLSPAVAERFAAALGLRGQATEYFCELVRFNQARSARDRASAHERLSRLRPERALRLLDEQHAAYCGALHTRCGDTALFGSVSCAGGVCTEVSAKNRLCLAPCSSNSDCQPADVMSCSEGVCQLRTTP